jgi:hypothetical protein
VSSRLDDYQTTLDDSMTLGPTDHSSDNEDHMFDGVKKEPVRLYRNLAPSDDF